MYQQQQKKIPPVPEGQDHMKKQDFNEGDRNTRYLNRNRTPVSGIEAFLNKIHPFRWLTTAVCLTAVSLSGISLVSFRHGYSYAVEQTSYALASSDSLKTKLVNSWQGDDGKLTAVFEMTKDDPDISLSGAVLEVECDEAYDWIYIPSMSYDVDSIVVSSTLTGYDGEKLDIDDLDYWMEENPTEESIYEYSWLVDDDQNFTRDDIWNEMQQSGWIDRHEITVEDSKEDMEKGIVRFSIEADGNNEVWTTVNIVFYQDGKIVYGTLMDIDDDGGRSVYTHTYNIPEAIIGKYDSVKVVEISSY